MKTAIYQYRDGPVRESVHAGVRNMKAYAERIGADYLFEDNPNWVMSSKIHMAHHKTLGKYTSSYGAFKPLYDSQWDEYDKILFVSTNMFTVDGLQENIFDSFHGEIGICEESFQSKQRTSETDDKWVEALEFNYGFTLPRTADRSIKVYNAGMVLYSAAGRKKIQEFFTRFYRYVAMIREEGLDDFYMAGQSYIHAMMFKPMKRGHTPISHKMDVQIMNSAWNSRVHDTSDWRDENTKFVHCQFPEADDMSEEQLLKVVNLPRKDWGYDINGLEK